MPLPYSTTASLLNSVGINTHLNYGDTNYGNFPLVQSQLSELGVLHVRDGLHYWGNADALADLYGKYTALAKDGIRFCCPVSPSDNLGAITPSLLNSYYALIAMAIEFFEGPNELDLSGDPNWPATDRAFQQSLWTAVKGMAAGTGVPLLAPSLANWQNAPTLGDLTAICDLGNLHAYPGGNMPTAAIPMEIAKIAPVSGNKPIVVTETGYANVSELAAGKYMPRIVLVNFMNGIVRSYLYELLDQGDGFGLIRKDGTAKPAYTAVKNLLGLLGTDRVMLTNLNYSVSYAGKIPITKLLVQESAYTWLLFLWQEIPSYDLATQKNILNPTIGATVTFQTTLSVEIFDLFQAAPIGFQTSNPSVTVSVPDYPIVLRITQ